MEMPRLQKLQKLLNKSSWCDVMPYAQQQLCEHQQVSQCRWSPFVLL